MDMFLRQQESIETVSNNDFLQHGKYFMLEL